MDLSGGELSDRNARSRDELICPHCRNPNVDLQRHEAFAHQQDDDDPRAMIKNATYCPNCDKRCSPEKLEKQLADPELSLPGGLSIGIPAPLREISKGTVAVSAAVLLFLVAFLWLPMAMGPILGGSEAGSGADGPTVVDQQGNWTIYKNGDGYYIEHDNGQFLTPYGVKDYPHIFSSADDASNLLNDYLDSDGLSDTNSTSDSNSTSDGDDGPTIVAEGGGWTAYQSGNGTYITNGTDYLGPDSVIDDPYVFSDSDTAIERLTEYLNENDVNETETTMVTDGDNTTVTGGDSTTVTDGDSTTVTPSDSTISSGSGGSGSFGGTGGSTNVTGPQATGEDFPPLHGQVLDNDGNPIEDATVVISDLGRTETTDQMGNFEFGSSLPSGSHRIYAKTSSVSTAALEFTVLDSGEIEIDGSPTQALYVSDSDGTIAQNRLSLLAQPAFEIGASGRGSYLSTNVTWQQPENAEGTKVALSPIYTGKPTSEMIDSTNGMVLIDTNGTVPSEMQKLRMSGAIATEQRQFSGSVKSSSDHTFDFDGSLGPGSPQITIADSYQEKKITKTGSTAGSVPFNYQGTLPSRDQKVTLTGKTVTQYQSGIWRVRAVEEGNNDPNIVTRTKTTGKEDKPSGEYQLSFYYSGYTNGGCDYGYGSHVEAFVMDSDGNQVERITKKTFCDGHSDPTSGTFSSKIQLNSDEHIKIEATARGDYIWWTYDGVAKAENIDLRKEGPTGKVNVYANNNHITTTEHLSVGESTTIDLPQFRQDKDSLTLDSDGVEYDFTLTEVSGIDSPVVKHDGNTICSKNRILKEPMRCSLPENALSAGKNTVHIGMADGKSSFTSEYQARAQATAATVTINGTDYTWPGDFAGGGAVPTDEDKVDPIDINALGLDDNEVQVSTSTIDGLQPTVTANITYDANPTRTARPQVAVITPSGKTYSKNIPESAMQDGLLYDSYTMDLPADWFEAGEHEIRVMTTDASLINASLDSSGLTQQVTDFESKEAD